MKPNKIDNAIDEVAESSYVRKAIKAIILVAIVFACVIGGLLIKAEMDKNERYEAEAAERSEIDSINRNAKWYPCKDVGYDPAKSALYKIEIDGKKVDAEEVVHRLKLRGVPDYQIKEYMFSKGYCKPEYGTLF